MSKPGTMTKETFTTPCPPWCEIPADPPHYKHERGVDQLEVPGVIIEVSVRKNGNAQPIVVVDVESYDETGDTITRTACTVPLSVAAAAKCSNLSPTDVFMVQGDGVTIQNEIDAGGVTFERRPVDEAPVTPYVREAVAAARGNRP